MPEQSERRHVALVWALIALASVLLVFSITANWVQRTLLNNDEVVDTTTEILDDPDVQEQLSTFAVDQLYATVDVQAQIEAQLPPPVQPLAAPVGAAVRGLATDVAERALDSPKVQGLVSGAIGRAQARFVSLIRDEGEYVATTGGEVTFEYGDVIADLAARLGLDPATISDIRGLIQGFADDLQKDLTAAQTQIQTVRKDLVQLQSGDADTELEARLQTLNTTAGSAQSTVAGLEKKIAGVEDQVPDQLQGKLSDIEGLLADLDSRLLALEKRSAAVLDDPSGENAQALDSSLASLDSSITAVLERPVVQNPGELVLMDSSELDGVQSLFAALRNLGFVLPLLVLFLYIGAIYLAKGWRRRALMAAGGGILAATLLVLFAKRLIGNQVIPSLAGSATVEPAVESVWGILSEGLRERALFVLAIGLAFVLGGALAGPGRHVTAVRRFLAPYLREHPVAVYTAAAVLFLLWLTFIPGIENLGQVLVILLLAALAAVGIEVLRRQTAREFPPGSTDNP